MLFGIGQWLLVHCQKITNSRTRNPPGAATAGENGQRVRHHTPQPDGAQLRTLS